MANMRLTYSYYMIRHDDIIQLF